MGQVLKWRLGWSTSGRPRSFKGNYIMEEIHHRGGIGKIKRETL